MRLRLTTVSEAQKNASFGALCQNLTEVGFQLLVDEAQPGRDED